MKIEYFEGLLVVVILFIQLKFFWRTRTEIISYKNALPQLSALKISRFRISYEKLSTYDPATILEHLTKQRSGSFEQLAMANDEQQTQEEVTNTEKITISIIECDDYNGKVFTKVLYSLNTYLIKNHGAATDFHLVKDIVERNVSAVEEDINLTISIPLYLGLMGTMMGIVIGLFNIPDLGLVMDSSAKDAQLNTGIGLLIGGVKVAMIASFVGLLLTIVNSGWAFKGSRSLVEGRKNDFYTFIQTELLPVLNQSMSSTLVSLQRNLQLFNAEFTENLNRLSGLFNTNYEAIIAQEKVLSKLENINISQIAKFNVTVLKELQNSTTEFQKFNVYLKNVNSFVESAQQLTEKADSLLVRTGNFENIAENLENKLDQSQALLEFLSRHFQELENHKKHVNDAVADVGHAISGTFQDLRQHIQHSTDSIRQFTVDEIDALRTALSESRTNLGNLAFLESLNEDVSQFRTRSSAQGDKLGTLLAELHSSMQQSIHVLEQIQQGSLTYRVRRLFVKSKNG